MKFYSKGGKFAADPTPTEKKYRKPAPAAEPVPVIEPADEDANNTERRQKPAARRRSAPKRRMEMSIWLKAFLIFCTIIMATLLFLLVRKARMANDFRQLAEQIQAAAEENATAPTIDYVEPTDPVEDTPDATEPTETEPTVPTMLPKYVETYESNPDFFGWISLAGTELNYPVMRSEEDNEKYLYADFDGNYSYAGTPFADNKCTRDSDNILIYGHNIKDGSMFRSLFKYEDESYWEENPTILFSDLYGDYEYEIVAVFRDKVYKKTDTCFKFYQFIDAESESEFDYAISQFKEKSLYDTGVEVEYGDKLITLITCAYHVDNGRFVVVARRK